MSRVLTTVIDINPQDIILSGTFVSMVFSLVFTLRKYHVAETPLHLT